MPDIYHWGIMDWTKPGLNAAHNNLLYDRSVDNVEAENTEGRSSLTLLGMGGLFTPPKRKQLMHLVLLNKHVFEFYDFSFLCFGQFWFFFLGGAPLRAWEIL